MKTLVAPRKGHHVEAPVQRSRAVQQGVGFWLVAGAFLTAMAFSTVPTRLSVRQLRNFGRWNSGDGP